MNRSSPFNALWLSVWGGFLFPGWLLANHYLPWLNFHSDLWIAVLMLAAAFAVASKSKTVEWTRLSLLCAATVCVPFIHYGLGLIPFAGQAWIATAYLLGFALAVFIGAQWERLAPGQACSGLLMAIGAAAIGSVGIQLYQWLIADHGSTIWLLPSAASRPYANFAQPNQLATFLVWGLVACAWGVWQRQIRPSVAILLAVYLLFGIALTQSRTALVALLVIAAASWFWRPLARYRALPWVITALTVLFVLCLFSMDNINEFLLLDIGRDDLVEKTRHEVRLTAYKLFGNAVLHSPWWGYGWGETARAQMAVVEFSPPLGGHFFHAHNLFLDILVWCGIPLGGLLVVSLVLWCVSKTRAAEDGKDAMLVIFIGVVGWHSMTELPLHYASFLLPTGLMMGVLDGRRISTVWRIGRASVLAALAGTAVLLAVLTRDYLEVEANFFALRFERAGLSEKPPLGPPDVMVLTQLREYIRSMRMQMKPGMSEGDIWTLRELAYSFPSEATIIDLMMALTLNNRIEEARLWLRKLPNISSDARYAHLRRVWLFEAKRNPKMLELSWPEQRRLAG